MFSCITCKGMKATFWIGCILFILLSCTGICMATDDIGNSTDVTIGNGTETLPNATMTGNVTEPGSNETVPSEPVESVPVNTSVNVTPETVSPAENVSPVELQKEKLVSFVQDARQIALKAGKDAAISAFNDRMGPYADPKMPVFAFDSAGNVLANPMDLASVGTNQIGASDSEGTRYVQMMIDTAKNGEGFVEFTASNILEKGKVMKKLVYVSSVDGSWFIGAGFYPEDI